MTEADIEIILQAANEKYPEARPRIISDNGPQFLAKDFKEFIQGLIASWLETKCRLAVTSEVLCRGRSRPIILRSSPTIAGSVESGPLVLPCRQHLVALTP
jgi:hypothetical protein